MDLMSVAVRFTTAGESAVKGAMAGVRKEASTTGDAITKAMEPAQNEFKGLAKSVNEVGNQLGLGLNRGLAQAGRGLAEAATAATQYLTQVKAATGATTLLGQAQLVTAGAARVLSGVLAAFGGPVGVALIGAMLLYQKLTDSWAEKLKEVEEAYDSIKATTQKVYDQIVAQTIGWNNVARSIRDATNALDAYRRGGESSLQREKDWQDAIRRTRAQVEQLIPSIKKLSDEEAMLDATFAQAFARHMQAIKLERGLTDAIDRTRKAEELRQQATKAQEQTEASVYETTKTLREKMRDLTVQAIEAQKLREKGAAEFAIGTKRLEIQTRMQMEAEFQKWADRVWKEEQQRRMQLQNQIAGGLANAIQSTFSAAFEGKNPLRALGEAILGGLGDILIQLGTTALAAAPFVAAIRAALDTLSGGALAAAGVGLIGLGSILKAGGRAIGGGSGSSGSYGGNGAYGTGSPYQDTFRQVTLQPTSVPMAAGMGSPQPMNITIIGPNDPKVQREMQTLMRNAGRRGDV